MAWRHWILALTSGLGACALSGCLRPPIPATDPLTFAPRPAVDELAGRAAAEGHTPRPDSLAGASRAEPARPEEKPPPPPPPRPAPSESAPAEIHVVSATLPARPDPAAVAALRCLLDKRSPDEALAQLESCDPADREVLRDVLRLAARLGGRDGTRASPAETAAIVAQLEGLARSLRPRAALVLDKLCFCRPRSIETFGIYEPLEDGHAFRAAGPGYPGERGQIYAEVRNFASHPVGDTFETVLEGKLEIHDGQPGKLPVVVPLRTCTDRSRTPRQDYFLNVHFDTPRLPPGSYTLWVEIKDITPAPDGSARAPRVARRSLDFQVVGDTPAVTR